ncbi:PEP-utilizing protein mobile subunit [Bacillus canaveralius]|uniref:PEP-utilizing protein mobile subunit n=1 Tax=Bacillus canaveralius TaxID=1403243 RepID=A0A2N5GMA6_9BACI|nr:PEP-utilizing enzyme [Bacillus canaveralius]PLR82997.1 PEP-utilizing protein mobile subunit [Bacillus canaveralius]PLR96999.1 PEP-utilizing protein mobile subunit [Bacillus canaveralius]
MTVKSTSNDVLGEFFGSPSFQVNWQSEADKKEFWWFDDLHVPRPVSPLYFDIGGWWGDACKYMYRRFGVPFGKDWQARNINGYVYTAVMRREAEEAEKLAPYFGMMLPIYATRFLKWWDDRYLPEIKRNLEYLDKFPYDEASLPEMMVLLEDALDIQERHLRIHWILNLAQFAAFQQFGQVASEVAGEEAASKFSGKILVSVQDKNWDSSRDLWSIKEEIKVDSALQAVFSDHDNFQDIITSLDSSPRGKEILQKINDYKEEYGYKAVYTHEYTYELWKENPAPIYEMLRNYLDSDYDFHKDITRVAEEQKNAVEGLRSLIQSEDDSKKFESALELALAMAPLTPDHHFYIDQGTYARMRISIKELGKKFAARDGINQPEDIFYLLYDEIRQLAATPDAFDARALVAERKAEQDRANDITPRDWVGTADYWSLYEQAYVGVWGYPERFELSKTKDQETTEIQGLAASPGVVEGIARFVNNPEDFDKIKQGEILVCRMTNPAWTLLFSKISGLVTDSGGALSHPAVIAREYGIPAVTSTLDATSKIRTGQRIRVDGSTGIVSIIE